jgi:trimeric autotransporter adhesin
MKTQTLLLLSLLIPEVIFCQLTGSKTIPGDYPNISSAISALNSQGVGAGGVVFNINAGYTESFSSPTAGHITSNTGSLSDPIIFQKSGSGANPKITAATGSGTMDAIICFNGVKYITFDGIDIQDKSSNTNPTTRMEWGYAILKASGTQGSQNITIKNCSISLIKSYNATYAIYCNNHNTSSTTQLTVTSVTGQNSNNKFYGNSISSSYNGIYLNGYRDTNPPYLYYDQGNDIGSVTGNSITNFGGNVADAYCIRVKFQNDITIANCNINGGTLTGGDLYGIYGDTALNANVNIYGNVVTLNGNPGGNSSMFAIYNQDMGKSGTDNTVNIYNNIVQNCSSPSSKFSEFHGCSNIANGKTVNFHNNLVTGNSFSEVGTTYWAESGCCGDGSSFIYNNTVSNNQISSYDLASDAYVGCLSLFGRGLIFVNNNHIYGNIVTAGHAMLYGMRAMTLSSEQSVTNNIVHDLYTTNLSDYSSNLCGIQSSQLGTLTGNVRGNSVYNLFATTLGSGIIFAKGIENNQGDSCANNAVHDIQVSGRGQVVGIGIGNSPIPVHVFNNIVHNITCSGISSEVSGILIGAWGNAMVYNNFISDLQAPNDTLETSISGINVYYFASSGSLLCNNTIYLNALNNSDGPFGASGIYVLSNVAVEMKNNIVVNTSSAPNSSSFKTVAYRRSSPALSSYSLASNNNDFYAGTPGPNNLIYYDGTNADQTLSEYKARVAPRDSASVTENPPFVNVSSTPYDLHIQPNTSTLIESHGLIITSPAITTDFDNEPRFPNPGYPNNLSYPATAPDIGADEFAGGPGIPLPTAITDPATNVTLTSARLNGTVNANGQTTSVSFQWGVTTSYSNSIQGVPNTVGGITSTSIIADLPGLSTNQTYHYRIVASGAGGTTYGQDKSFTTLCPLPSAPGTISGPTSVCQNGTGYVYSVNVIPDATSYQWTLPAGASVSVGAGTNSITVNFSPTATSGDVIVAGVGTCGTGPSSTLAVTVNALPEPASGITGNDTVCPGASGLVYSTAILPSATNYIWTVPSGANIVNGSGTDSIIVDFTTNAISGNITVYGNNFCGNGTSSVFPVVVNPLPVPTITGSSSVCLGTSATYTTQPGMIGYSWNVPTGGTIQSGGNTEQITVLWTTAGTQTVMVNYTSTLGCTALVPGSLTVTVEPVPSPTISGMTSLCVNSGYYNYITEAGFYNYQWTISPGGIITSGIGTNQVLVSWTVGGQQWIAINYSTISGCNAPEPTLVDVTVNDVPSPASAISGTDVVCAGVTGIQYSTAVIPGAMTYVWIIPGGCSVSSGAGTNTITVDFSESAISGNIIVQGNNLCGNGIPSPEFPVVVNPIPSTPVVTIVSDTLISSSPIGNQWYYKQNYNDPGTLIAGATDQKYIVTENGYYWTLITQNNCESDTSNNIHVVWMEVNGQTQQIEPQVYPVPNSGNFKLSFYSLPIQTYSVKVYNGTGSAIYELTNVHGNGTTEVNIDLGNVARGIYLLVLSDGLNSHSLKILII